MTGQEALTLVDTLLHSAKLGQKLNDIQSLVFRETWEGNCYREIAEKFEYQYEYIKQVGSRLWRLISQVVGEEVSKSNVQAVLRRHQHSQVNDGMQDWREAIDVSHFFGRQTALQTLETWILDDGCRSIGIFGLGGIGKTALSIKLAQQVQSQFECVIWRSLREVPPLEVILSEILPLLAGTETATDISITALIKQLRQKHCLLVFDNIESILQDGNRCGQYQPAYQAYRRLFERISDETHQSCLMITGREKPREFALREGNNLPVRSLHLPGLSVIESRQVLIDKGLKPTDSQCQAIVNYLGGNPLALKIAATTIQTLFGGNIQEFLGRGNTIFSDLWDLLERQFQRLSPLQQQIMYWLAMNREAVTPAKLYEEILPKVSWRELLEALESLEARMFLEAGESGLTLQPVIMEYVTQHFITTIDKRLSPQTSTVLELMV